MSLKVPPPPPLPSSLTADRCFSSSRKVAPFEIEQTPFQEILYAIKKLPQWRSEEDLDEEKKSIWLAVNNYVSPLIQDGPTCGLVVLKLSLQMLQKGEAKVEDLLQEAREKEFTCQGEMFSAQNMLALATTVAGSSGLLLTGGLEENREIILTSLRASRPVLVPYDADPNHEPGCHGGHKAHWSLLTGYLMRLQPSEVDVDHLKSVGFSSDPSCPNLFHTSQTSLQYDPAEPHRMAELFVFARQGKSKHLGVWSFKSLSESNNNLKEFSPSRDEEDYLLPQGGVEEGLCGKAVVLLP